MKNKIILVGGSSANPPHLGHESLLDSVSKCTELFEKIIWIPSGNPPYKKKINIHPDHRIAMTELMIKNEWKLGIYRVPLLVKYDEIYNKYKYAYKRLLEIQKEYPNHEIAWFTGSDSNISTWYHGEELLKKFKVFYIIRKGYDNNLINSDYIINDDFAKNYSVSSTFIRDKISKNENVEKYLNPLVYRYIQINNLYKK